MMDVDIVPARELGGHGGEYLGVRMLNPTERLIGEDDSESERVVVSVALPYGYLVSRP